MNRRALPRVISHTAKSKVRRVATLALENIQLASYNAVLVESIWNYFRINPKLRFSVLIHPQRDTESSLHRQSGSRAPTGLG
jgi:hypothetical protein